MINDPDADTLEHVEGQGKVAAIGKATGSPAGSKGTARVETEASEEPGRSIVVLTGSRVCQLKGPSIGRQMPRWKSDPLIVLRARESRVHGEARAQDNDLQPGHISCTQREGIDVNATTDERRVTVRVSWEARCGKSARRVLLGGRGTRATEASLYQPYKGTLENPGAESPGTWSPWPR